MLFRKHSLSHFIIHGIHVEFCATNFSWMYEDQCLFAIAAIIALRLNDKSFSLRTLLKKFNYWHESMGGGKGGAMGLQPHFILMVLHSVVIFALEILHFQ